MKHERNVVDDDPGEIYALLPMFVTFTVGYELHKFQSVILMLQWILPYSLWVPFGTMFYTMSDVGPVIGAFSIIALVIQMILRKIWVDTLPNTFTFGEASVVISSISLAMSDFAFRSTGSLLLTPPQEASINRSMQVYFALEAGVLGVLCIPLITFWFFEKYAVTNPSPRTGIMALDWHFDRISLSDMVFFLSSMLGWLLAVVAPLLGLLLGWTNPILWVLEISLENVRLVAYWILVLGSSLPLIHWVSGSARLIIVRKLYHFLSLLLFVPAIITSPLFLALAMGVACALLLLVEYIRICRIPPLGNALHEYMSAYIDNRDQGPVILTHLYLLVGCAAPLWCFDKPLATYAGLIVLGAGDSAGAMFGVKFGTHHWFGGRKTLEGSVAMFIAMMVCVLALHTHVRIENWSGVVLATLLTCILEACTSQIDNLVLPLFYASLLNAMG